jgi:ABC-2 type transport system ATP-binding protein
MPAAASLIILSARNLTWRFNRREIIHGISLELKRGEVLGLLGHNGAGKSTTLQMLSGAILPHSGQIEICGLDLLRHPINAKAHIGFLPENPPLYQGMRVDDYLVFVAKIHLVSPGRIADALSVAKLRCGLRDAGHKIIGTLSKGYQQRVGIAQAIIHTPEVIILDEPTVGLDPAQIRDIRTLIRELGDAHGIVLSTHSISEVESVCDRIEIMQDGCLVFGGAKEDLMHYGNGRMNLEEIFIQLTEYHASGKQAP